MMSVPQWKYIFPDGRVIMDHGPFTLNDNCFPDNWLPLATSQDLEQYGIIKEAFVPVLNLAIEAKVQELAAYRYDRETSGIVINGMNVDTSRASQSLITGAKQLADVDQGTPVDFKGANGWVVLDSTTISAIAVSVGRYVRGCFSAEKTHYDNIMGLTSPEEVMAYNIGTGWPSQIITLS